ncbi:hypothetical protein J3F83DRAFT_739915 [Trichoderma novae-zelandiae]
MEKNTALHTCACLFLFLTQAWVVCSEASFTSNDTTSLDRNWRWRMGFGYKIPRRARDRQTLTGLCSERLGGNTADTSLASNSSLWVKFSLAVVTEERVKG